MQGRIRVYVVKRMRAIFKTRSFTGGMPRIGHNRKRLWIVDFRNFERHRVVVAHGNLTIGLRNMQPFRDDAGTTRVIQIIAALARGVNAFDHRKCHDVNNTSSK